jgi:sucrose-6-phosphate hydrolase SacC (GH32 family)
VQNPVDQLNSIRGPLKKYSPRDAVPLSSASFELEWYWGDDGGSGSELILDNNELVVRFNKKTREVEVDRSGGSKVFNNEKFRKLSVYRAKVPQEAKGDLKFRLFFDQSIAELYVGDGELVMTAQVFPEKMEQARFTNTNRDVVVREIAPYR